MCILFVSTLITKQTNIPSFMEEDKTASAPIRVFNNTWRKVDIDAGFDAVKYGEQEYTMDAEATHEDRYEHDSIAAGIINDIYNYEESFELSWFRIFVIQQTIRVL